MLNMPYEGHLFNEHVTERNPEEHLDELPEWNRQVAMALAADEGIELTDAHWEVLHYLRRRLATQGQARSSRILVSELKQLLGVDDNRSLFKLFPRGPVTQGSRIAGVPAPAYHADYSFGSVQ